MRTRKSAQKQTCKLEEENTYLDGGSLLALSALSGYLIDGRRRARRGVGFFKPFRQKRLQFAHILKTELQRLEPSQGENDEG